jgi:hypothetical protein
MSTAERGGGQWTRILFLPVGLLMFFETNRVVGFRVGPVLTWLFFSLAFCALGLYSVKRWFLLLYGVVELLFGAAITFVAINAYGVAQSREYVPIVGDGFFHRSPQGVLQLSEAQIALFGMLAAIYVLVRGLDDVGTGLREHPKANACWQRCFGRHKGTGTDSKI